MADIKKRVSDPQNPANKIFGTVVKVVKAEEPHSYVHLEDGTVLTSKNSILEVIRIDDRWDDHGQPIYNITQSASLIVTAPEELMREGGQNEH